MAAIGDASASSARERLFQNSRARFDTCRSGANSTVFFYRISTTFVSEAAPLSRNWIASQQRRALGSSSAT